MPKYVFRIKGEKKSVAVEGTLIKSDDRIVVQRDNEIVLDYDEKAIVGWHIEDEVKTKSITVRFVDAQGKQVSPTGWPQKPDQATD